MRTDSDTHTHRHTTFLPRRREDVDWAIWSPGYFQYQ